MAHAVFTMLGNVLCAEDHNPNIITSHVLIFLLFKLSKCSFSLSEFEAIQIQIEPLYHLQEQYTLNNLLIVCRTVTSLLNIYSEAFCP